MDASIGTPSSPPNLCQPSPATVLTIWVAASIRRIRLFRVSAMYKLSDSSKIILTGSANFVTLAKAPSPENPKLPVPAIVVKIPGKRLVITVI